MFESAALPHVIDKATWKVEEPKLHEALLAAQLELVQGQSFPVIVVIAGLDAAGKGEAIQKLYQWLDPRHLRTLAYGAPSDEERTRPPMWRFWRDLPPKGKLGIVFGSWYSAPLRAAVLGESAPLAVERALEAINRFEQMLADEGALIIKLWFHLARAEQKARLRKLKHDPGAGRHVLEEWAGIAHHKTVVKVAEQMARQTSRAHAPWVVIPSADDRFRDLAMGQTLLAALQARLAEGQAIRPPAAPALIAAPDRKTVLDALDLSLRVAKPAYNTRLAALQDRLAALTDAKAFRKIGLVIAFEGTDAAGKGGVIRRVTQALDPRRFDTWPIAAPTDEERAQPYLWRFWRHLPRKGNVTIFDRSWYGRVLVERVEGFADEPSWLRAYNEINDFEAQLHEFGLVVVKFWLAISAEEQLRRFKERENTAFKQHKITDEDWRNRAKWDEYRQAVADMVDRTSTSYAPWTLIEAEDKRYGRLKVLETICTRIEAALAK
jgi:polyphosphate:AMP phosphotransferase